MGRTTGKIHTEETKISTESSTCIVDGVFDLFHVGHLNILKAAKKRFEICLVGLNTDEFVERFKGAAPVVPFEQRKQILESIIYMDGVVPLYDYACYTQKFMDENSIDFLVHGKTDDPTLLRIYTELIAAGMYYEVEETSFIRTSALVEICKNR